MLLSTVLQGSCQTSRSSLAARIDKTVPLVYEDPVSKEIIRLIFYRIQHSCSKTSNIPNTAHDWMEVELDPVRLNCVWLRFGGLPYRAHRCASLPSALCSMDFLTQSLDLGGIMTGGSCPSGNHPAIFILSS